MNKAELDLKVAGLEPWKEDFGAGMERRGADGMSWYDLSVNLNSAPCERTVAVILTAWHGQLKWLRATLESYRRSGAFVILAYDNPLYAWGDRSNQQIVKMFPTPDHYLLAHAQVMKHITYDADKRNGWLWSMRYAQGILRNFRNIKHVYHSNGDCVLERPEGMSELVEMLGENDLMSGQQDQDLIHTAAVLWKADAFHRAFDWMAEEMRIPVMGSHSPEVMIREACQSLGLKVAVAPEQPKDKDGTIDVYCRYDQPSTWKTVLGFRNLFASYETAGNEGREPTLGQYADLSQDAIYWSGEEKETIVNFWKTGDRRYLWMWLDRWEDSDYNRLYTPMDFYAPSPVFDRADDVKFYREVPY